MSSNVDLHARYVHALRAQTAKTADAPPPAALPCPYCDNHGRIFQDSSQLYDHAKLEHADKLQAMGDCAPAQLRDDALNALNSIPDLSSKATAGGGSTPDLGTLSLGETGKARHSPYSSKKRPAETDFHGRRGKLQGSTEVLDPAYSRDIPHTIAPNRSTPDVSSESSVEINKSHVPSQYAYSLNPHGSSSQESISQSYSSKPLPGSTARQPGVLDTQRYDPRYPDILRQPDSRPITQEQLASEVKSIYAGLTMVESKSINVDNAQLAKLQDVDADPNARLQNEHWGALIALHRTLLHEHHDFFLASQHPSASPALRRLASKYSMPARMWKHGIHSFLELLRRRLPESIDYMLTFIYLAYQMMALLYETVPAFEDTWIECLGDLGRYRMAIEDEDVRDRETWAGVARSWYSKAADKNPNVGRLYHHLAILARPNALQQLYYYARSLTCVKPFASARESILTLLDPFLGRQVTSYSHALPVDTSFIQAHGILFRTLSPDTFEDARQSFQSQLDNHIGRVTAKWREQGVYIAVTNIAGLFEYGSDDATLRQLLLLHGKQLQQARPSSRSSTPSDEETSSFTSQFDEPSITAAEVPSKVNTLSSDFTFSRSYLLTMSTLSLVLRRIGDNNVHPHVHVLLSFLSSFASIPYVADLIDEAPWSEAVPFLNALLKSERSKQLMPGPVFPTDLSDHLPLPEDYLIRGQLWSQWYFPENWFAREHDEEDRYLEPASTVKSRAERILRLGYEIATHNRWIHYDQAAHTFSVLKPTNLS